jgi:hypothetical protein
MGCGSSSDAGSSPTGGHETALKTRKPVGDDPAEVAKSSGIDRELDRARQQEELKVKLLLLGAGESGKSTIFKQMRILHGSPRTEDDLRMYGVVVRSNVITAMRKLCQLLRMLEMENQLAAEPPSNQEGELTPKQAFDNLVAHLVENTAPPLEKPPNEATPDWVGHSPRAGLGPNNDAKQFLQLWRQIKVLWEVSFIVEMGSDETLVFPMCEAYLFVIVSFVVKNNERSVAKTSCSEYYRWTQRLPAGSNPNLRTNVSTDDTRYPTRSC